MSSAAPLAVWVGSMLENAKESLGGSCCWSCRTIPTTRKANASRLIDGERQQPEKPAFATIQCASIVVG